MARQLAFSAAYHAYLEQTFSPATKRLAPAIRALSDHYVGKTGAAHLPAVLWTEAYTAYYGPVNALKLSAITDELRLRLPGWPGQKRLRVLDIGAGPGSATLGITLALPDFGLDALWLDNNPNWSESLLIEPLIKSGQLTVRRQPGDFQSVQPPAGLFDIVVMANTLVELKGSVSGLAARFGQWISQTLAPDGVAVIVEPALKAPTRNLHELRSHLLRSSPGLSWRIAGPCPHEKACPMLETDRDWCHETRDWLQPAYHHQIDQLAGLRKDALRYSWLALTHIAAAVLPEPAGRVVSEIRREKGRTRFVTCGTDGRLAEWQALERVIRTTQELAETMKTLERGHLVKLPGLDGGRLSPASSFGRLPST